MDACDSFCFVFWKRERVGIPVLSLSRLTVWFFPKGYHYLLLLLLVALYSWLLWYVFNGIFFFFFPFLWDKEYHFCMTVQLSPQTVVRTTIKFLCMRKNRKNMMVLTQPSCQVYPIVEFYDETYSWVDTVGFNLFTIGCFFLIKIGSGKCVSFNLLSVYSWLWSFLLCYKYFYLVRFSVIKNEVN